MMKNVVYFIDVLSFWFTILLLLFYQTLSIYVTGGMFEANGTTSVPMSIPRLMLDKVRLLFSSEMLFTVT